MRAALQPGVLIVHVEPALAFEALVQLGLAVRNLVTRSFGFAPLANLFLGRSLRDEFTLPQYDDTVPLPATARLVPGQGA